MSQGGAKLQCMCFHSGSGTHSAPSCQARTRPAGAVQLEGRMGQRNDDALHWRSIGLGGQWVCQLSKRARAAAQGLGSPR